MVYSNVYSGADERKRQNTASLAFVRGIHPWPVTSPHKGDDLIVGRLLYQLDIMLTA